MPKRSRRRHHSFDEISDSSWTDEDSQFVDSYLFPPHPSHKRVRAYHETYRNYGRQLDPNRQAKVCLVLDTMLAYRELEEPMEFKTFLESQGIFWSIPLFLNVWRHIVIHSQH